VKLRDLPRAFGIESAPREYPYEVATFQLPSDGEVRLARWLHPGETAKIITQESVDALRTFLREGDVAIDIGAHTGDSTLPMALAAGPTGCVYALEPNPYVFKVLKANAALNPSKTRIVPLMFAATPADGQFEFEYSDSGYCNGGLHQGIVRWKHGHFCRLVVAGRNLEAYLHMEAPESWSKIRYIKIDTEGLDHAVVQSIENLIGAARPYIKAEMYRYLSNQQRLAFYDDLRRLGYRVFMCESDCVYRGPELGPNDLSRGKHFDVFAVPE
jgi:FkbM family methyltransferase